MPRPSRWKEKLVKDGVAEVNLTSWKYFHDYVRQEMLDYSHYVWRGQRDAQWPLESSLDRRLRTLPAKTSKARTLLLPPTVAQYIGHPPVYFLSLISKFNKKCAIRIWSPFCPALYLGNAEILSHPFLYETKNSNQSDSY